MLLVAIISRQFSWAVENNRQKSRQLEKLEMLARAILVAPPDASSLAQILSEHIPSMFPSGRVAVWINQDQILALHPDDWDPDTDSIWEWLQNQTEARSFLSHESLPWNPALENHRPVVAAPVIEVDSGKPLGGVYLELYSLTQPWDTRSLTNLYPAIQALAAQIASALHQAEFYSQALAYQKVSQELVLAGRIQASFLPDEVPTFSGWQIAVTLLPARETSGDYFDLIPLTNGKLGILIADVTDKGIGAALYMALSRTLIRTYAIEFDEDAQPDVIFFAANNRLLRDARADLFVTTFYGILDPETGELSFCNAGHNPPYLVRRASGDPDILPLHPTGMPIGVEEDTVWSLQTVRVDPGDVLVLYTDGIPDSQNIQGEFFGEELLISSVLASAGQSADEIQESILENVMSFSEGASQFDDITLLVLVRDEELGPDEEQAPDDDLAPEEYIVRDGDLLRDEDLEPDEDVEEPPTTSAAV
jgi:serine phosphatase RsbU (regulator of sigma subunit)